MLLENREDMLENHDARLEGEVPRLLDSLSAELIRVTDGLPDGIALGDVGGLPFVDWPSVVGLPGIGEPSGLTVGESPRGRAGRVWLRCRCLTGFSKA